MDFVDQSGRVVSYFDPREIRVALTHPEWSAVPDQEVRVQLLDGRFGTLSGQDAQEALRRGRARPITDEEWDAEQVRREQSRDVEGLGGQAATARQAFNSWLSSSAAHAAEAAGAGDAGQERARQVVDAMSATPLNMPGMVAQMAERGGRFIDALGQGDGHEMAMQAAGAVHDLVPLPATSEALYRALGSSDEDILRDRDVRQARIEENPWTATAGEIAGQIAPSMAGGRLILGGLGAGAAATGGAAPWATNAVRAANVALQGSRLGRLGVAGARLAATGASEGVIQGALEASTAFDIQDEPLTAEAVVASMGRGAAYGAVMNVGIGATAAGMSRIVREVMPEAMKKWARQQVWGALRARIRHGRDILNRFGTEGPEVVADHILDHDLFRADPLEMYDRIRAHMSQLGGDLGAHVDLIDEVANVDAAVLQRQVREYLNTLDGPFRENLVDSVRRSVEGLDARLQRAIMHIVEGPPISPLEQAARRAEGTLHDATVPGRGPLHDTVEETIRDSGLEDTLHGGPEATAPGGRRAAVDQTALGGRRGGPEATAPGGRRRGAVSDTIPDSGLEDTIHGPDQTQPDFTQRYRPHEQTVEIPGREPTIPDFAEEVRTSSDRIPGRRQPIPPGRQAVPLGVKEAWKVRRALDRVIYQGDAPLGQLSVSPRTEALRHIRGLIEANIEAAIGKGEGLVGEQARFVGLKRQYEIAARVRDMVANNAASNLATGGMGAALEKIPRIARQMVVALAAGGFRGVASALAFAGVTGSLEKWFARQGVRTLASTFYGAAKTLRAIEAERHLSMQIEKAVLGIGSGIRTAIPTVRTSDFARAVREDQQRISDVNGYLDQRIGGLWQEHPRLAAQVSAVLMRQHQAVAAQLPAAVPDGLLRRSDTDLDLYMSDTQKAAWLRYRMVAHDPSAALDAMRAGTVTPEMADALRTVHPAMYQRIRDRAMLCIAEGRTISYGARIQLAILFPDTTPDPTLSSGSISKWQEPFLEQAGAAQGGQAPQGSGNAPDLSTAQYTDSQRRSL